MYNVLVEKLNQLGVRKSSIPWIIDFLTELRKRIILDNACSKWLPIMAGVPQGTKLGPVHPVFNNGQRSPVCLDEHRYFKVRGRCVDLSDPYEARGWYLPARFKCHSQLGFR